jgi:hypothetical protein
LPNNVVRIEGKAASCNSLRRSSNVLLISIFPPPPTIERPPGL